MRMYEKRTRSERGGSCVNIRVNLGNVQETFFVEFTGVDYSRLNNYKIIKFTMFVRGGGKGGGGSVLG